jgi:hypothetical protein
MKLIPLVAAVIVAVPLVIGTPALAAPPHPTAAAKTYKNCTELQKVYKHGVGKKGAKDKTSGKPVTTFTVNTAVYKANTKSDRDKDGIACEKR